ncbi:hypothetical protein N7468_004315 [Penicillium chermesinum]|uniref:Small ribosomal subunit protein mS38 n=1 Tax=Penicillium chermesinum TaxID=63820 RepID=A0A9W9P8X8_9EURO|nr:uncharacterized protein N7468_004315 [Penicillium chermesinum]KAJ5239696.1 hypothetical protein N7468_004315 [Penicillium chermesinum]
MLSTSLRRAVWAPLSGLPRPGQHIPCTGIVGATRQAHQRRYSSSSSKPPVPPSDGSRRMDTSTPSKGVNSSGEKSKSARRRGKDNGARNGSKSSQQHAAFSKLPSVPSTQHRQPHDVHVASFFSIHRPISVTTTVPPTSSSDAFDAIFSSKKSLKNDPEEVVFTLSSAVQTMENSAHAEAEDPFGQLQRSFASDADGELRMLDGPEARMSVEEYTRRLRPFQPPPAPVPMNMELQAVAEAEAESMEAQEMQNQETTYSTVLTIRESRSADGRRTYEAHTGPFVRDEMEAPALNGEISIDAPAGSTSGMTYGERRQHNHTIQAISTKRRRKVKMKKHKFKKLMRRTRTLRRKLDKA